MRKRNTFTPLLSNRIGCDGLGSWVKILAVLLSLCPFVISISCDRQKAAESPSNTKTNSLPMITSVTILPERPNRENDLSLVIQSQDADGDLVNYRYQWIKNDIEIAGESGNVLKAGSFRKGDRFQVRVIPSDGKGDGKPFLSNPVKILNAAPVVSEVWIEPQMPTIQNDLKVHEKSTDPDEDSIFFSYQWEKNGAPLMDERKDTLERVRFKKGDSISVTIVPDDREIMGSPKKSEPVKISNSPPTIVSSPPTSIEGTKYLYQVRVNDPDNDPITFTLKSGPKGMGIDPKSGLLQWQIRNEDKGTHTIDIEASDNEGARSNQQYTLAIEVR
jgi:Putative Ig domain